MAINQVIGEKISTIRAFKKIGTDVLAERTGLSEEQLRLIESGESIPSLGVLIRITRALGTRLGTLLDDTLKEGPSVIRADGHEAAQSFSTNENQAREHLTFLSLAPNKAGRHMEPFLIDIVPDGKNEPSVSSHEGEEFIYVLEGNVTVYYGSDELHLRKGDSIYLDSIIKHQVTTREGHARILGIVYVPV
jgi:transcriptional regulator with XRE-family HTH domain